MRVSFEETIQDEGPVQPMPSPPPPNVNNLTPKFHSKDLRGNLMREQHDRDPLFYYEVLSVLGVGSMGSVAKVRKKKQVIGGSARKELQAYFRREKSLNDCYHLPFVGGFFQWCLKPLAQHDSKRSGSDRNNVTSSGRSSILQAKTNIVEDYNDGHGEVEESMTYAMKSIHLSRVTDPVFVEELRNEIHLLKNLDHAHIVKAIETFEYRNQIFIVQELCSGGDLYGRDPYTEDQAARIVSSILSAVAYMHSKNVAHRDLKYENILFVDNSPQSEIKLIDFGLSKKFGNDQMTEGVGTIYTMAPEVLKGKYTKQADVWSIGVIAYMLMSSQMPFYGRKRKHIVEQIMAGQYEFRGRRWKRLSAASKDFVEQLLVVDPEERVTAEEALSASWLNRRFTATVRNPLAEELICTRNSLLRYSKYSKLKKVALMVVAHKSTSKEIGILRKVFQQYDTKRDGQLSYEEFRAALADAGFPEEEYQRVFDAVDLDGSGKIRYTEFLAATIEAQGAISEERLAEAFDRIDSDDSGYISAENLKAMLGDDFPTEEIAAIITESDLTKDGKISYAEFLALWENRHEKEREEAMDEIQELAPASVSGSSQSSTAEWSEASSEINPVPEEIIARANFIEGKLASERSQRTTKDGKRVMFDEDVSNIPQPLYSYESIESVNAVDSDR